MNEPPTKMQALELPEGESDDEYEAVPKKTKRNISPQISDSQPVDLPEVLNPTVEQSAQTNQADGEASNAMDATDDDWLRSRTNRLLDLIDPTDISVLGNGSAHMKVEMISKPMEEAAEPIKTAEVAEMEDEDPEFEGFSDKPDPVLEAIKANGRLFVRNLPYSATEDDLKEHFKPYGSLEEVSNYSSLIISPCFYDEYPDRDSLCFKHVM